MSADSVVVHNVSQPTANQKVSPRVHHASFYSKFWWGMHVRSPTHAWPPVARCMPMTALGAAICLCYALGKDINISSQGQMSLTTITYHQGGEYGGAQNTTTQVIRGSNCMDVNTFCGEKMNKITYSLIFIADHYPVSVSTWNFRHPVGFRNDVFRLRPRRTNYQLTGVLCHKCKLRSSHLRVLFSQIKSVIKVQSSLGRDHNKQTVGWQFLCYQI